MKRLALLILLASTCAHAQYLCYWGQPCEPSAIITGNELANNLTLLGTLDAGSITTPQLDAGVVNAQSIIAQQIDGGVGNFQSIIAQQIDAGIILAGSIQLDGTSGSQLACTSAATCQIESASGQSVILDIGGGTAAVNIGTSHATSLVLGRSGQPNNVNGNVSFGTAGPNMNGTTVGVALFHATGALGASATFGTFLASGTTTNLKFNAGSMAVETVGSGGNNSIVLWDVTAAGAACTFTTLFPCGTAIHTPVSLGTCGAGGTAVTSGHLYGIRLGSTTCSTTQPSNVQWSVELTH